MPAYNRQGVLQTGSAAMPTSRPPDPRRAIEVRAAEDTDFYLAVVDDGSTPVHVEAGAQCLLTVRPTPAVDDEKVFRVTGVPEPVRGPNIWRFSFSSTETRRKSPGFQRGYYDVVLIAADGRRNFVVPASPFRLLGEPGAP